MPSEENLVPTSIKMPHKVKKTLEDCVDRGILVSMSEFMRSAVLEKLSRDFPEIYKELVSK